MRTPPKRHRDMTKAESETWVKLSLSKRDSDDWTVVSYGGSGGGGYVRYLLARLGISWLELPGASLQAQVPREV